MSDEHKLKLYNRALTYLGLREIASLAENRAPRRALDRIWDLNFIDEVLSEGYWNFAARTTRQEATEDVTPPFGLRYAFEKPIDWIRTYSMCSDESYLTPILRFEDEQGYWFADMDTIYVKYVSNHTSYGGDLSLWPPKLFLYAACLLAKGACLKLTNDSSLEESLTTECAKLLSKSKGVDGSNEPPRPRTRGSWARMRTSGGWRSRDGFFCD